MHLNCMACTTIDRCGLDGLSKPFVAMAAKGKACTQAILNADLSEKDSGSAIGGFGIIGKEPHII